jgi:hypothetical protein
MTEAQFRSIPAFQSLPIYDEHDELSIAVSHPAAYQRIRECVTVADVEGCLRDQGLVPLGALRAPGDGSPIVIAYFGVPG